MENQPKDQERDLVFLTGSKQFFDRNTSQSFEGKLEGSILWKTEKGAWVFQYRKRVKPSDDNPFSAGGLFRLNMETRYEKIGQDQAIRWLIDNGHFIDITEKFLEENEV